jgi:hypothetical protein
MKQEIKIESGIPLPKKGIVGRKTMYPVRDMKVGDSFAVEGGPNVSASVWAAASRIGKIIGAKFTSRRVEEGGKRLTRIWRVE